MPDPIFIILYVDDPPASAAFYSRLLARPVIESSATFALLPLREGTMLGLWSRHTVAPSAEGGGGGAEVAFTVSARDEVDATHAQWRALGLTILQAPDDMDFGRTFVALDPDRHRLRVFAPNG
jgi:catechol 2,3-dioxygenase-like lactoylglutathione lyase family enzyme